MAEPMRFYGEFDLFCCDCYGKVTLLNSHICIMKHQCTDPACSLLLLISHNDTPIFISVLFNLKARKEMLLKGERSTKLCWTKATRIVEPSCLEPRMTDVRAQDLVYSHLQKQTCCYELEYLQWIVFNGMPGWSLISCREPLVAAKPHVSTSSWDLGF